MTATMKNAAPNYDAVTAEAFGHGERGDEHCRHRDHHRAPDQSFGRIDSVGQPGVGRPRPPERDEEQQSMSETAPSRIVGENRRDLGEPKDEDEVEEELERTDPLLAV